MRKVERLIKGMKMREVTERDFVHCLWCTKIVEGKCAVVNGKNFHHEGKNSCLTRWNRMNGGATKLKVTHTHRQNWY